MINPLRKHLDRRAKDHIALANNKTPAHLLKTPSQKRSEAGRAKFDKRAGVKGKTIVPVMSDCRDCEKACTFNHNLNICPEHSIIRRCSKCGQQFYVRIVPGQPWETCKVCKGEA